MFYKKTKQKTKKISLQTHVHLWSTAAQQVDKSRVEGHDRVPHVNEIIIIVLDNISVIRNNHTGQKFDMNYNKLLRTL